MKKIKIDQNNIKNEEIRVITDYLKRGKVIVYPTDTIYGLGCLVNNKKAVERVYKIKKRDKNKPLLVLMSDMKMLKKYCDVSQEQEEYLDKIWPGPVSVILKYKNTILKNAAGDKDNIAVRLPKNDFLDRILIGVNMPLISTSLNISGQKNINNLESIENYFKNEQPDLIVDAGPLKRGKPSKLIDIININKIKILRN